MTWHLAGFHAALIAVVLAVSALNLRADAAEEVRAADQLAALLAAAAAVERHDGAAERATLAAVLAEARPRHLALRLLPADAAVEPGAHRLPAGRQMLLLSPDDSGERDEKRRDALRLLLPLLAVSLATVLAARLAVGRALLPVRGLVDGLARLERGERAAVLPQFALPEFAQVAAAVDRLAAHLDRARAAERQLARRLIASQEEERRALARELHDEFGQSLTAIGLAAGFVARHPAAGPLRMTECAQEIGAELRRIHGHLRSLLTSLRPHGLEGVALGDALAELLDGYARRGLALERRLPAQLPPLDAPAALALFRLVQEALTNVLRHADATRASVRLALVDGGIEIEVADDGSGSAARLLAAPGCGLTGMRERLAMAGGRLTLLDAAPRGVRVIGWLPLERAPRCASAGAAAAAGAAA
ncbi:sensor histidine kinase [Derxia lacustris]|uniref:sensor histidine kinase n=1 Tax=Derxia lacustris TaxID=764842 RepID=UPI000A1772B4|nr:histidine kinase [Derxia lacustris]